MGTRPPRHEGPAADGEDAADEERRQEVLDPEAEGDLPALRRDVTIRTGQFEIRYRAQVQWLSDVMPSTTRDQEVETE